ncbi:MAG: radical SAM protein [Candidatus Lokiarchaeota archaeon]|nr:radical SAM protein [Candidatus Lokiarchaeota archaeon]MBD3337693.1 radical SAM protein [Candidatus Lokiarchaeota archaeon]
MAGKYISDNKITNEFVENYIKTNYRVIGNNLHSAIKPCHWLEQRLMTGRENRNCYKGVFGVESHRCLQNTPALPFCNHQCVFCWRDNESGNVNSEFCVEPDDPELLVEEMLRHQNNIIKNHLSLKRYLDNYEIMNDILYTMLLNEGAHSIATLSKSIRTSKNKIDRALTLLKNQNFIYPINDHYTHYKLDDDIRGCISSKEEIELLINRELTTPDEIMQSHFEATSPNHAAISLDGEPMLYPKISDFVEEFRKRGMTTFIVTNGTLPNKIESLNSLPSQLYLTLPAPDEFNYKKICRPMIKNGWQKIMKSTELLSSLDCRTLLRLTAIKDLNIQDKYIENYVEIIEKANPNFFEIKGFTLQAKALDINKRLKSDRPVNYYYPEFEYLDNFAKKIEEKGNFPIIYTNEASRDFLFAVNWNENEDPIIKKP